MHGTIGEAPLERFMRPEAQALQPLEAKPSFMTERERPGSRSRQVIDGHWDGLLPQRQRREAERSQRDASERRD